MSAELRIYPIESDGERVKPKTFRELYVLQQDRLDAKLDRMRMLRVFSPDSFASDDAHEHVPVRNQSSHFGQVAADQEEQFKPGTLQDLIT